MRKRKIFKSAAGKTAHVPQVAAVESKPLRLSIIQLTNTPRSNGSLKREKNIEGDIERLLPIKKGSALSPTWNWTRFWERAKQNT